jgi:hydroxymethylbilane synthase
MSSEALPSTAANGESIRIGTRGSPLALAQANDVARRLTAQGIASELVIISTTGDQITDRRLLEAGGKGLFTKELDEALLDGRVDIVVHSLKDVPARLPDGIALLAFPEREDPRDALICRHEADSIEGLSMGAKLGTASVRRQAQALALRPDLRPVLLRGNVQTRLSKVADGTVDATFLAAAGLNRLGLLHEAKALMPLDLMPPAPCQGIVGIAALENVSERTRAALALLNHTESAIAAHAERTFLAALDGSCRTPISGYARQVAPGHWAFLGEVLSLDGRKRWRDEAEHLAHGDCVEAALTIAERLKSAIGGSLDALSHA